MNISAPEDYPHRKKIQHRLYLWAQRNPVNFPWRKKISRFHALVAEILLQRTKAEQVVPVFNSFRKRFPSIKSLAITSPEEIQLIISSLGLAWRAKFLKALAEELSTGNSRVPDQYSELTELPGIGPYAASAYLSLHRGTRMPIIDNNVVRFYSRLLGCSYDGETRRKKWVADFAEYMTPKQRFKEYNYAILDYTRLVCKPKPICHVCSYTDICQYAEQVKQTMDSGISIAEKAVDNMPNEDMYKSHRKT